MSKPIPSTRGVYLPGVGKTITQANIADEQAKRLKIGDDPATPDQIVRAFCPENCDEKRHYARARRLMLKECGDA